MARIATISDLTMTRLICRRKERDLIRILLFGTSSDAEACVDFARLFSGLQKLAHSARSWSARAKLLALPTSF